MKNACSGVCLFFLRQTMSAIITFSTRCVPVQTCQNLRAFDCVRFFFFCSVFLYCIRFNAIDADAAQCQTGTVHGVSVFLVLVHLQ